MPLIRNRGGSGGAGFTLGPIDNIFGDISGNASANPLLVMPAINKPASESIRDAYFTANPSNLATYDLDGNEALGILLYFSSGSSNTVQPQTRVGGEWRDSAAIIAIQGLPGSGTDFSSVSDGHLPAIGPGPNKLPFDSGMRVLPSGQVLAPKDFGVESGSIDMGDLIRLSEAGGFLGITNAVTGAQFNVVDFFTPRLSPSNRPQVFATTEAERLFVAQPDLSNVITTNPLLFNYTTTLSARTNSLLLKANGPMTNVTMRITDTVSGVVFKYLPDKAAWIDGSGGYDFVTGDNVVDLFDSPLPFDVGRALSLEIKGDSIDLLGTTTIPYFAAMLQNAEFRPIPYSSDIEENVQSDWNELSSSEDSFILNKPTIPTPRTDEEIRDVSAAPLTSGTSEGGLQIEIIKDDAADTVTFNLVSTAGSTEEFYHGLSDSDNPASVVLTTLSQSDVGTGSGQTFDFSVGPASVNDYIILLVPSAHDIATLINTGSGFSVLSSFTKTDNVRVINGDQYHSYVLGPLVDTYTADYRATLS